MAAPIWKLPPLLERRRKEHAIPDGAFRQVATFDRVLLWQIPDYDGDFFKGTGIVMPEQTKKRNLAQAPRGVVVTAGLEALDYLWSHGIEVGSVVKFVRLSPWFMPVDIVDGSEKSMAVVRASDCVAAEDIAPAFYDGGIEVVRDARGMHHLKIGGEVRTRHEAPRSEDY